MKRCEWARSALSIPYHDEEWGVPVHDDRLLFEFLILEGAQAGLNWETILKKRSGYREAFDHFDAVRIAQYDEDKMASLLANPAIVRNRLKIDAAIRNAQEVKKIRAEHGSFAAWIDAHHPRPKEEWVKLFRKNFAFMGGEIVGEFLMSLGYLPGAHEPDCPVYARIIALDPPWYSHKL
jgi:DNA-3-methyladenine glycosylase I